MSDKALKRLSVEASAADSALVVQRFNTLTLTVTSRQRARKIELRLLKRITATLFADLKIEYAELGVHLIAAAEMARLNEAFLRHKGSTDVIAFDYGFGVPPSGGFPPKHPGRTNRLKPELQTLHGEIFICVNEAVRQARRFQTSWQSEIVRYLVHGILHLLGHDDSSAGQRRKMKREENRLLRELSRRFSLAQLARPAKLSRCKNH